MLCRVDIDLTFDRLSKGAVDVEAGSYRMELFRAGACANPTHCFGGLSFNASHGFSGILADSLF